MRRIAHLIGIPLLTALATAAAAPRAEISLNGAWEAVTVENPAGPSPPPAGWKPFTVPGLVNGVNRKLTWFRRSFDVAADWRGSRVHLRFNGVKYNSTVLVNGLRVGGCFNGYDQFTVDATAAVKFGAANELLVAARDWSGIFEKPLPDPKPDTGWDALRSWPRDNLLSPIGGRFTEYGIWDDVTLLAVPPVRAADITITTSVRRKWMLLNFELANETGGPARVTLTNSVMEAPDLAIKSVPLTLAAGQRTNFTQKVEWRNPKLWDYEHPHLYHLVTRLEPADGAGAAADELRTRFGFREFWVERGWFYLNGAPLILRATASWPVREQTREDITALWKKVKAANTIAMRTHTQPWRQAFYDAADQTGLLMIPEGAIWNDRESYRVDDERFWKNYRDHLAAMWRRLKNNPSVVMWSLENEFYGGRCSAGSRGESEMAKAGVFLKQLDPTRPITYESDGDPRVKATDKDGVADVIGMHYPHEYPQFRLYPDTAYWLPHGRIHRFWWPSDRFKWNRDKPLYIGEFLWLPSNNPDWHTLWFGDEAYANYGEYRNRGKGLSWRDQIIAYRAQGLSGIGPWTMFEGGPLGESNHLWQAHAWAYHPIGVYLREADTRFFGGDKVSRTFTLFNDTLRFNPVAFEWSVLLGGKEVAGRRYEFDLKAAQQASRSFMIEMPEVKTRTNATLVLKTSAPGAPGFEDTRSISLWPRPVVAVGPGVAIYGDPRKDLPKPLDRFRLLRDLGELATADLNVLIVLPGALDSLAGTNTPSAIGDVNPRHAALMRWVRGGGRALVFPQGAAGSRLLPVSFMPQTSTMTFPQDPQHPALRGVEADDLKFWRGDGKISDVLVEELAPAPKGQRPARKGGLVERGFGHHVVTSGEAVWDARAGAHPIVVAGNPHGLSTAPLCEARRGKGAMLLCGLQLIEKLDTEPVARRILQNCLDYLSDYKSATSEVTYCPDDRAALLPVLRRTGAQINRRAPAEISGAESIVVFDGDAVAQAPAAKLRALADAGATIWLHRPPPGAFDAAIAALGLRGAMSPAQGPIRRAESLPPVAAGLAREDLYWLGARSGFGWSTTPQARDSIRAAVKSGGSFTLLAEPGALAVAAAGRGIVLVDTLDETSEAAKHNGGKFARLIATLLANAGADFVEATDAVKVNASAFEPVGKIEWFRREADALYLGCAGKVVATIHIKREGEYALGFIGRGTPANGQYPILEVALDGRKLGQVELASVGFTAHDLNATLPAGQHELSLSFINDLFAPDGDRNLWLNAVEFRKR